MKFALSRSLWHGRSSIGSARRAQLDPPADRAGASSYSGGMATPRAERERPVRLDDPERHEQARDRRPVVDPAERVGDPPERLGSVDRLVRLTGDPTMNRVTR